MSIARSLISAVKPLVNRFPRLVTMYRSVRDELDIMDKPITTQWGFNLAGNPSMAQGDFEPTETKFVREILKDVDVLVNVGANIGYYCCHALSMGKSVIAFEPIRRNLHYLCQNIKANNWSGAEIYPIALSNRVGVVEIYGGGTGASILKGWAGTPESYVTLAPSSTMDVVLGTRLRGKRVLVLVDVEGAEKLFLEGAIEMLNCEPKPTWFVEIMTKDHQPTGIELNPNFISTFEIFFQNGYQAFNVDQDMRPVTIEQVKQIANGSLTLATHNYLFKEYKSKC